MELKVGQTIYAINECVMDDEEKTLTIGKAYLVESIDENSQIMIIDDELENHYFPKEDISTFFTTEPPKTERYFIVFYENTMVAKTRGIYSFTTNGEYPNRKETEGILFGKRITNIIELNQQDYESWNK